MQSLIAPAITYEVPWFAWLGLGICLAVFFLAGFAAAIVDVKRRTLPNICVGIMFAAALVFQMIRAAYEGAFPNLPVPFACMWGCILFMVAFFLFEIILRKTADASGFGAGDIKFIGAWALLMGPIYALVGGTIGAFIGAVVSRVKKESTFAVGPWIFALSLIVFVLSASGALIVSF